MQRIGKGCKRRRALRGGIVATAKRACGGRAERVGPSGVRAVCIGGVDRGSSGSRIFGGGRATGVALSRFDQRAAGIGGILLSRATRHALFCSPPPGTLPLHPVLTTPSYL